LARSEDTGTLSVPATPYQALLEALRSATSYNRADMVSPAVVLWTDKDRHWEDAVSRLQAELPLLTLGTYDPETLTGPAIWLRCVLAGTLECRVILLRHP
jgi:hypothetical protein